MAQAELRRSGLRRPVSSPQLCFVAARYTPQHGARIESRWAVDPCDVLIRPNQHEARLVSIAATRGGVTHDLHRNVQRASGLLERRDSLLAGIEREQRE